MFLVRNFKYFKNTNCTERFQVSPEVRKNYSKKHYSKINIQVKLNIKNSHQFFTPNFKI